MSRLGTFLKDTRESKGLSIEKVTQETRLSEDIVTQLEEGGFAALPSYNHAKNFVKNYAEYLGVDADEAMAMLAEECTRSDFTRDTPIVFSNEPLHEIAGNGESSVSLMKYILPAVVIILVIFAGTKLFLAVKGAKQAESAAAVTEQVKPDQQTQPQTPAQQEDTTFNTVDPKTVEKSIEEVTTAEQENQDTAAKPEGEVKPGEEGKTVVQDGVIKPDTTTATTETDKLKKDDKDKKALQTTGNMAVLNFADVCWVHVKSDTGEELDFIASRGSKREVTFKKFFVLDVGNAAVASVTFNGKVISGLGGYKQPAKGLKFEPNETGALKYSTVK